MIRLIRPAELATSLNVTKNTIYQWIQRGILPPPIKIGLRAVAWREDDIELWVEKRWRMMQAEVQRKKAQKEEELRSKAFITTTEACEMLKVSRSRLALLAAQGKIKPPIRVGPKNNRLRWHKSDLEAFMREKQAAAKQ
ncbi:MAG: hypothetical protein KatS3mg038_3389 [Candidatus Kapaibacterium sp.]|nr:MAG: hypothetical protein KatS3mg038_1215 [Candidatus Kapabacteria bacterium]GIV52868.1 MAG: hypothetical protein KatS3mg038_3389 [Candidatus Kapabacteria bacterium]